MLTRVSGALSRVGQICRHERMQDDYRRHFGGLLPPGKMQSVGLSVLCRNTCRVFIYATNEAFSKSSFGGIGPTGRNAAWSVLALFFCGRYPCCHTGVRTRSSVTRRRRAERPALGVGRAGHLQTLQVRVDTAAPAYFLADSFLLSPAYETHEVTHTSPFFLVTVDEWLHGIGNTHGKR